jgi:spore maturation protein CgeB
MKTMTSTKGGLRIAFFGSSLLSAYWNGAATYYRGMIRALDRLGHRVTFYEPDAFDRQRHRDFDEPSWAKVVVYRPEQEVARALVRQAGEYDVVVKASGVGVLDELLEAEVLTLRSPRTRVLYWDVDAPATLDRVAHDPSDGFRPLIREYDLILTYGGGPPVLEAYGALGARHVAAIYNALDPDTHHPVAADPQFAADLTFIGNRLPDREARVEEFFLRPAAALPRRRFLLGGNGWADRALPPNVVYLGHVYTHQHNPLNCSSLAVLNVNRESMARYGYSPPTRFFEVAGAGACLLTDAWEGIEEFLSPGKEILVARSGDEVIKSLNGLSTERARAIGEAAKARILDRHTYAHRAKEVEQLLLGNSPVAS